MITLEIKRTEGDFGFEATDEKGHTVRMDMPVAGGGSNYGVSPMQSMLMGLAGCSGIDVVSILKKQRQELKEYKMIVSGEREKDKTPALWEKVHIAFHLEGKIDPEKAKTAIKLSIDKYCSVAETLRRAGATISWDLVLNGIKFY